jgi:hypothetical protein
MNWTIGSSEGVAKQERVRKDDLRDAMDWTTRARQPWTVLIESFCGTKLVRIAFGDYDDQE